MYTIIKNIKNNVIIALIITVGIILLIISGNLLANMGNVRNENPLLAIPHYMANMQWVMFLSAAILMIFSAIAWKISSKRKPICIFILALLILIGAVGGYSQIKLSKYLVDNNAVSELPQDVSENFMPISLNTFECSMASNAEGVSVYYISRVDCTACEGFEKSIAPFLEENAYSMNTYFTNSDRDGVRSEEMYKILARYGITTAPAVIIKKDGKVTDLFLEPELSLDKIKNYVVEEMKN